jgi:hypothetical protein
LMGLAYISAYLGRNGEFFRIFVPHGFIFVWGSE